MGGTMDDNGPADGWDLFKWKWLTSPKPEFAAVVYVVLFLVFCLLIASGFIGLYQLLVPLWTGAALIPVPTPNTNLDTGAELRGRLLVIGTLLTTPFLVWRIAVSHWSARAAQFQARIAKETAQNSLSTKAIEQLGATRDMTTTVRDDNFSFTSSFQDKPTFHDERRSGPNIEVRLGAIYALEQLARDVIELHWPIMETLCAYIRENSGSSTQPNETLIKVLARGWDNISVEDREALNTHVRGVRRITVDVEAALMVIGRRSKAQRDHERDQRSKSSAMNENAWRLNLTGCYLVKADLAGLDLSAARLGGSNLSHANCSNTHFEGANLDGAHFEGAQLTGANLKRTWLHGAHLEGSWLNLAHFEGATFIRTHLEGAFLPQANLQAALLKDANFRNANLQLAHCEWAHFERTVLDGARLEGASLDNALVDGVDLSTALDLSQKQVETMWGDEKTRLPAALVHPANDRWLDKDMNAPVRTKRTHRWFAFWKQRLGSDATSE